MARRSLKEAVENSPQLEAFVFGQGSLKEPTLANKLQPLPRKSINLTFSFTPDCKPLRHYYNKEELEKWAEADIKPNGIQSPLWVRPMPESSAGKYELVAGLRRYYAAEILDLDSVPAIVYDWDDKQAYFASLSENINRRDFSVLEQLDGTLNLLALKLDTTPDGAVQALYRLNNEMKKKLNQNVLVSAELEQVESAFDFLGQISWQSFVSTRLPLLKKPPEILQAVRQGKLHYTKALEIAKIKDDRQRQELLELAIAEQLSLNQIKQQIAVSLPQNHKVVTTKDRFSDTYKRVKAAKVWEDPKKAKQLEKLMAQLEQLLEN